MQGGFMQGGSVQTGGMQGGALQGGMQGGMVQGGMQVQPKKEPVPDYVLDPGCQSSSSSTSLPFLLILISCCLYIRRFQF